MLPGEIHDQDFEPYQSIEEYAGPFDSIYYMGCGIDRTPSEAFQTDDILHVDHDPAAVEYLNESGLNAKTADVTDQAPERDFDLVILAHLTDIRSTGSPLIEDALKQDGSVICSTLLRAKKLSQKTDLSLEALHLDGELTQETEIDPDADKYFFK